jgi:malonate-semialdehyde dehydrogenase (acetylating) / methylmalonate-semialdehyde dehydrogenase
LKAGYGLDQGSDLGPITNKSHLQKIHSILDTVEKEGGKLLLDGRGVKVPEYPNGNWIGASVISDMNTNMTSYQEEIFGPVMCVLQAETLDEAISIINK